MIRRIASIFIIVSVFAASSYAVNIVDTMTCKKVVLRYNNKSVLVSRITGKVEYVMGKYGQYIRADGVWKSQLQAMYDAQTAARSGDAADENE